MKKERKTKQIKCSREDERERERERERENERERYIQRRVRERGGGGGGWRERGNQERKEGNVLFNDVLNTFYFRS